MTRLPAVTLARLIRQKQASSVEVVEAHLRRIDQINPVLNAMVQLDAEKALAQARRADADVARGGGQGPLHGVPFTIKDSLDTAGMISTGGTQGRASFVPPMDATVVARLRSAGAVLLGKTNTPELTLAPETDNLIYGKTNNPYDPSCSPGGSSGGAAAIIAAGGSPLDIGSDTGGSVRYPAHACGIAGLKPTAGRVPRTGHIIPYGLGFVDHLTQIGPLARDSQDLALALQVISGVDWRDPTIVSLTVGDPRQVALQKLRVAVHTRNGMSEPSRETVEVVRRAAATLLAEGLAVEEDKPGVLEDTVALYQLREADGGNWIRRLLEKAGTVRCHPWLSWVLENARLRETRELTVMLERLDGFRSEMLAFLENYDVILCPVNARDAVPHDTWPARDDSSRFTYTRTFNLTGWPAVVVRAGTSERGLPIGIQIVARPWREDVALAVGRMLEEALGGWSPPAL